MSDDLKNKIKKIQALTILSCCGSLSYLETYLEIQPYKKPLSKEEAKKELKKLSDNVTELMSAEAAEAVDNWSFSDSIDGVLRYHKDEKKVNDDIPKLALKVSQSLGRIPQEYFNKLPPEMEVMVDKAREFQRKYSRDIKVLGLVQYDSPYVSGTKYLEKIPEKIIDIREKKEKL